MNENGYNPYKKRPTAVDNYHIMQAQRQYRKAESELRSQEQAARRQETLRKKQEREQRLTELQSQREEEARKNAGFFERMGYTIADIGGNLVEGLLKFGEGIVDAGASIVGGIGGLFDKGFQDNVKSFVANDHVGELFSFMDDVEKKSYLSDGKAGRIVRGVSEGIGQNLPAIGLSLIPGAGPALGMGSFMGSASGNGTEEAFGQGADYGQGLAYGALSGLVEGGTEALTGGLGGTQTGKVLGRQLGKSTLGKLGITMVGEGAEEVLSDLANPLLKRVTGVDPEARVDFQQLPETFMVGGLTGAALGGAGRTLSAIRNRDVGGFKAVRSIEYMQEMEKLESDVNRAQVKGKLTDKKSERYIQDRAKYSDRLEEKLAKMNPEHREAFVKKFSRDGIFDENGHVLGATPIVAQGQAVASAPIGAYEPDAYSASLRGREETLEYKPTAQALTADQRVAVRNTIRLRNGSANVVITDQLPNECNGVYKNGVLYVSSRADSARVTAAHELTHSLEGTKEYARLERFLLEGLPQERLNAEIAKRMELYKDVNTEYSVETKIYEAKTEYIAERMGELLSDQAVVDRIVAQDRNLAIQIYNWVKSKLASMKDKDVRFLLRAEKMYRNALNASVGGVALSDVEEQVRREKEKAALTGAPDIAEFLRSLDQSGDERYSKKNKGAVQYDQYRTLAMQWANATTTKQGDTRAIYNARKDTWDLLVADETFDEGFGVMQSARELDTFKSIANEVKNGSNAGEQGRDQSIYKNSLRSRSDGRHDGKHTDFSQDGGTDERIGQIRTNESERDGERNTERDAESNGIRSLNSPNKGNKRYSLKLGEETIGGSVVPSNTSAELLNELKERKIKTVAYDKGARTAAVNTIEDARFSLSRSDSVQTIMARTYQLKNDILSHARSAQEIARRKGHVSAAVLDNEIMLGFVKAVGQFKTVRDINSDVRARVAELGKFYNRKNPVLYDENMPDASAYDTNIGEAIEFISERANSKAALNVYELEALHVIERGILHLYKHYDKVYRQGKYESTGELAAEGMNVLKQTKALKGGNGFFQKVFGWLKEAALSIVEPSSVVLTIDGFDENGVLTRLFGDIKQGEIVAANDLVNLMAPFEAFRKEHKDFSKQTRKRIKFDGAILTLNEAMTLYLTAKRAQANISVAGFTYEDENGKIVKHKFGEGGAERLYEQFDETTRAYIETAHALFNRYARDLKKETDLNLQGYTVLEDGDGYIPIIRDDGGIAKRLGDPKSSANTLTTAYNFSFNKAVREGVKTPVRIIGLTELIDRHAKGVALYHGLAIPIRSFSQVYNRRVGEGFESTSMREELSHRIWNGAESFFTKLFNDIQGLSGSKSVVDRVLRDLRGKYSVFQLGFNPKTVLSQTSSYPMAYVYLDVESLVKGAVMKTDKEAMFRYAPLTRARMHDRGIVRAQGLVGKIGKIGDVATKPIQGMDNLTVGKLWNASQVQVEKDSGCKIGTEENLKAAGELLTKVLRETQSNSIMTERSAVNRSDNFLVSSSAMFMSDATKQFSRLYNTIGALFRYKTLSKKGDMSAADGVKKAKKRLARTVTAVAVSNLAYTLIGLLFKYLYDKPEEERNAAAFFKDYAGSMVGMIPVLRDVYGYLADDFEINNYAIGMLNDAVKAVGATGKTFGKILSGQPMTTGEMLSPTRQLLYAFGQFTGLPVRNVYNVIYGTVNRFSPATALKMKTLFYNNQTEWRKRFEEAVENDNAESAAQYAKIRSAQLGWADDAVSAEVGRLAAAGQEAFPRAKTDKLSLDGTEYVLSGAQQRRIFQTSEKAEQETKKLLSMRGYRKLSDAVKAKAIRFIQIANYHLAVGAITGVAASSERELTAEKVGIAKAALFYAMASEAKATATKTRREVIEELVQSNSFSARDRALLMSAIGYKRELKQSA